MGYAIDDAAEVYVHAIVANNPRDNSWTVRVETTTNCPPDDPRFKIYSTVTIPAVNLDHAIAIETAFNNPPLHD